MNFLRFWKERNFLKCLNCGFTYQDGDRFCGECGADLQQQQNVNQQSSTSAEQVTTTNVHNSTNTVVNTVQQNSQQYLEKGKEISKLYGTYFLSILKNPVPTAEKVEKRDLTNGLITIVLFALMLPLITFFAAKRTMDSFGSSFGYGYSSIDVSFIDIVLKPTLIFAISLVTVGAIVFLVVKLGQVNVSIMDVWARLGAFLVVPTTLLGLALLTFLLDLAMPTVILLSLGLLGFSIIIPLLVYSFKRNQPKGLDTFYCTILTYVGISLLFVFFVAEVLAELIDQLSGYNSLF